MSRFLKLTANVDNMVTNLKVLGDNLTGAPYGPAREAFSDISALLVGSIRENILGQDFTPLSPVTVGYKARKGLDPRILVATGRTMANLRSESGATWAKARRGEEWYIFLHDRGAGYSYWSVDGRAGTGRTTIGNAAGKGKKKGAWRTGSRAGHRGREGRAGTTEFPTRHSFYINAGAEASVLSRYDLFLQTACDEVGSGAA